MFKLFNRIRGILILSSSHSNLRNLFSQFLLGIRNVLLWTCCGGMCFVWCRCVQIPRNYWHSPTPYWDVLVRDFDTTKEVQRIDFCIEKKKVYSLKQWLLLKEALRRIESGEDLVRREQIEGQYSSDLEPLQFFLRLERRIAKELYESCCVLTAELFLLDETRWSLAPNNQTRPSGSLHIHRNSQVPAISLRQSSIRRISQNRMSLPSNSGNRLIAPGEEQDSSLAWQDPAGPF